MERPPRRISIKTSHVTFTHRGVRSENQDGFSAYTAERLSPGELERGELFVVADGMGGHRAGRQAATAVCQGLAEYFTVDTEFPPDFPHAVEASLIAILERINNALAKRGRREPEYAGWGSTASALVLRDGRFTWVHAGDTRIYLLRGGEVRLLTTDQNVAFENYRNRHITYEEYLDAPGKNHLTSYVGQGDDIALLSGQGGLERHDVFLLCTDGLNQFAQLREIEVVARTVANSQAPEKRLRALHNVLALRIIRPKAARDNVTYMLVCVQDP